MRDSSAQTADTSLGGQPVEARAVTHEMVAAAMQEAWDEFGSDTGCFPDCFRLTRGPKLWANFQTGNFALMVTNHLNAALAAALSNGETP